MPVSLFTYHAYGSWLADRRQGYVERGGGGIQGSNAALAREQRGLLSQPAMEFDQELQRSVIDRFLAICREEDYQPHTAAAEPSHFHLLVSWDDVDRRINKVGARLKNLLALHVSRTVGPMGRKWFSRGASRQRVKDRRHFDHLMTVYLPKHDGVFWSEVDGWR